MCGISGVYSFAPRVDRLALRRVSERMTDAIATRGPDSAAVWADEDAPLVLGHRRLAILDLSPAGHQPMESASGRYMIVFNGEIYNFKQIKARLKTDSFRGDSDTEILLAAIEEWGLSQTLEALNGMFAFALWDKTARMLHCARDRFGKKPLYIGWAGSDLVFASELKAIMAHPDFRRDVDRGALTSYMRFGYVPAPFCMFKQMRQLPAGMRLSLDLNMMQAGQDFMSDAQPYWSAKETLEGARYNMIVGQSDAEMVDGFEGVLSQCVADRMIADVPLGAFLSGGVDSSAIVALMQHHAPRPVKTYTIGFHEAGFNEADHAKEIAAHLGTDHHEMYVTGQDALTIVPKLPQIYDEPFADISAIPTFLVSQFARHDVTVALSGDGGDEMLGGYTRHLSAPKVWAFRQAVLPFMRQPLAHAIRAVPDSVWRKLKPANGQFSSHMHKVADIIEKSHEGDAYLAMVSQWPKPKSCVVDGYEDTIPLVDPAHQVEGVNFTETMMYWDTISYLCGDILTKVDRASMAASLEARAPLLDRRIYEHVWRLPFEAKIRDGRGKWLLRQVLERHVPRAMFDRPKQGFAIPVGEWLRGDLRDWAEDLLDETTLKQQGLLHYPAICDLWSAHKKGRGNHQNRLWTVLMFQAWLKEWNAG